MAAETLIRRQALHRIWLWSMFWAQEPLALPFEDVNTELVRFYWNDELRQRVMLLVDHPLPIRLTFRRIADKYGDWVSV